MSPLVLGVILLVLGLKTNASELVTRPRNAATLQGTPVSLRCATPADNTSCHWQAARSLDAIRSDSAVPLTIYDGDDTKLDSSQYFFNRSSPGQCDLAVLNPRLDGPLLYACSTNNGFGEPSYASLVVLKSNLMCANNVIPGTTSLQTVEYSLQLVYAGDMDVSVYSERSDGSVEKIVCEKEQSGRAGRRLECNHQASMNETLVFFAAVSHQIANAQGLTIDRTVPAEKFYCFTDNNWSRMTVETDNLIVSVQPQNETADLSSAVAGHKSCHDELISTSFFLGLFTGAFITGLGLVWFCCHQRRRGYKTAPNCCDHRSGGQGTRPLP